MQVCHQATVNRIQESCHEGWHTYTSNTITCPDYGYAAEIPFTTQAESTTTIYGYPDVNTYSGDAYDDGQIQTENPPKVGILIDKPGRYLVMVSGTQQWSGTGVTENHESSFITNANWTYDASYEASMQSKSIDPSYAVILHNHWKIVEFDGVPIRVTMVTEADARPSTPWSAQRMHIMVIRLRD